MKIDIEKLKKEHGSLHQITSDDKKYKAIFRQPTKDEFFIYQDLIQKQDSFIAISHLADTTFVAGDKKLVDEEEYFLGIVENVLDSIEVVSGELKGLVYTTEDGKKVKFKKANRNHYGQYERLCKYKPTYEALETVLRDLIVEGEDVLDHCKYYPGLNSAFINLINVVTSTLKKL